jgi:hypothetical protein
MCSKHHAHYYIFCTLPLSIKLVFFSSSSIYYRKLALSVHSELLWIFVCTSYSFIFCCSGADFQGIRVVGLCKALQGIAMWSSL